MSRARENWLFVAVVLAAAVLTCRPSQSFIGGIADIGVDMFGLAVSATGVAIRLVARAWKTAYGKNGLVTSGPYSIVRNPMYVGSFLVGLGLCLILGSYVFLVIYSAAFAVIHGLIARREESELSARWPDEYRAYRASVPGWFPSPVRVLRVVRPSWLAVSKNSLVTERANCFGIIIGAVLAEAWAHYAMDGWSGAHVRIVVCLAIAAATSAAWLALEYSVRARGLHQTG